MPHGYSRFDTLTGEQKDLLKGMGKPIGGKEYDITRSPQYQQAIQQLQGLSGYYRDLMSPNSQAYQQFAAPAQRQFQEEIMPGVAEQYAGVGGLSSSGFQQAAAAQSAGLAERLAALRSGLQMQGAQGLQGLSQQQAQLGMAPYDMQMQLAQLNQQRYATALGTSPFGFVKKPESSRSKFLSGLGSAIPGAVMGGMKGGVPGAAAGGLMGFFTKQPQVSQQVASYGQFGV